jgi:RNA polymerase sigma factor (sigma-70 family)
MDPTSLGPVLRHIRRMVGAETGRELTDRQLLQRFQSQRDEVAFAALVERHGRLVWSVCRHVLGHEQDAEDAWQASFLALARNATSIRKAEALASWLHGVAYRVAQTVRRNAIMRRNHERQREPMPTANPTCDLAWRELQAILDEEIQSLPAKYRSPFILCCLEGLSKSEAAAELGWKAGTVSSRLAEARKRMQQRLARRGVALTAVLGALALAQPASSAPAGLAAATVQAAMLQALGKSTTVSGHVLTLVNGVTTMSGLSTVKLTVVLLLMAGLGTGGVGLWPRAGEPAADPSAIQLGVPAARADEPPPKTPKETPPTPETAQPGDLFEDITAASGVQFSYRNGEEADQYSILESLGGGVGLIDYDQDGLLDLVITGGGYFDGEAKDQIKGYGVRLYKNLGNGRFQDVTAQTGLDRPLFYTHGLAVVDYDCDGWPDILVTGWGRMALFHNEPDGKGGRHFRDVTEAAGLPNGLWTTSAAWADFDADGFPDLFICQYLNWSPQNNPACSDGASPREICPPKMFKGREHRLYRNNGDGTFTDVSAEAGLRPHTGDAQKDAEVGKSMGVVVVDVNDDGKPDIFVTNDTVDNFLYLNHSTRGKIRFKELGIESGVARDSRGVPLGCKGVDAADFDGRGTPSLWCTNYEHEMNSLYRNDGRGLFIFRSDMSGIAAVGQMYVGFGTSFLDLDNDGWEDLVIANGHINRHPRRGAGRKQRPVLLQNEGNGRFIERSAHGGTYFRNDHLGRGLAVGDLDNDGFPDIIISNQNEPLAILRNQAAGGNQWLGIQLAGKKHRDVVGAKVIVEVEERRLTRFAKGGGSYLSSCDRRLLFGLAKSRQITRITVVWPPSPDKPVGHTQRWDALEWKLNRYLKLVEDKEQPE